MKLKTILYKLGDTHLFYTDKSGNSVFKNYNLFSDDGCLYKTKYSMPEVGKVLEYRFDLNRYANFAKILAFILVYLIFIRMRLSLFSVIIAISLFFALCFVFRLVCGYFYDRKLLITFGSYKLVNFEPQLSSEKKKEYAANYRSMLILAMSALFILMLPALVMYGFIRLNVRSQKPNFKAIVQVSKMYTKIYPKTPLVYDISAYARYATEDYEGALKDYETIFKITGKNFESRDLTRFANVLFLGKRIYGAQEAVDKFNEYTTEKSTSLFEQSQLLWIKSMFSVKNYVIDAIEQDYEDLLISIPESDLKNKFYILCDKAYMYYLMDEYEFAVRTYDKAIALAMQIGGVSQAEINNLYAERGYTRTKLKDLPGAKDDFEQSRYSQDELPNHEPKEAGQGFIIDKF